MKSHFQAESQFDFHQYPAHALRAGLIPVLGGKGEIIAVEPYKFEMKGRAFDGSDRLDKVAAGLTALQHFFLMVSSER